MLNPFTEVNWNPDTDARRKFALSLIIGFPCLAALMLLITHFAKGGWKPGLFWLGGIGLLTGIVLWLLPAIAKPFYLVWYFLGCCVGIITGNLILSLFFYLAITPVGLLLRLAGKHSLTKTCDRSKTTYWQPARKEVDLRGYFRQF